MLKHKTRGKFWPKVEPCSGKSQELYQMENAEGMGEDFEGLTAPRKDLREGGYFQKAQTNHTTRIMACISIKHFLFKNIYFKHNSIIFHQSSLTEKLFKIS